MAILVSLVSAEPAPAAERVHQSDDGVDALAVDFRDLDLSAPAGAAALIARLNAASDLVCRAAAPATPISLSAVQTYQACRRQALDRAVRALDRPAVTALYADQTPLPKTLR